MGRPPTTRSPRPSTPPVLSASRSTDAASAQRASEETAEAVRELQRRGSIPASGSKGDVFYRQADGRVVALPIGDETQVLTVSDRGLPTWDKGGVGPAGPPGPAGAPGTNGTNGAPGATGPAGPTNIVQATVDFGATLNTEATVTVTGQAWVTPDSGIIPALAGIVTVDHDPEDPLIEEMTVIASNLVPGVGFDLTVHSPGGSIGAYAVWAVGA